MFCNRFSFALVQRRDEVKVLGHSEDIRPVLAKVGRNNIHPTSAKPWRGAEEGTIPVSAHSSLVTV